MAGIQQADARKLLSQRCKQGCKLRIKMDGIRFLPNEHPLEHIRNIPFTDEQPKHSGNCISFFENRTDLKARSLRMSVVGCIFKGVYRYKRRLKGLLVHHVSIGSCQNLGTAILQPPDGKPNLRFHKQSSFGTGYRLQQSSH